MKLIFEGTTDEFTESLAVLKCFATVENIVEDETAETNSSVDDNFGHDLIIFFTALSRANVHIESCETRSTEVILRLFNVRRFWSFKITPKMFLKETASSVAQACIDLGS